ncbi:MAG: hypothetical protein ACREAA_02655 [Candidatus Polarisedimenticolia bacterium]
MRLKIQGGTVKHGEPSLCLSCRYATVVQGENLAERIIECERLFGGAARITFTVTSCTQYSDRRQPSLREMEETAWVLRSEPSRRKAGFVHARELKPEDRYVLDED